MTYNITLTANHQSLTAEYLPLAAESVQYLTAKVVCETEDWTGREIKAMFEQGCTVYEVPVTGGEITAKQQLNLTAGDWRVWLVGNSARDGDVIPRITTNVAHISVAPTGGTEGSLFPTIPPTVEERLRADMGNLADLTTEDKSSLVAAINEVRQTGGGGVQSDWNQNDETQPDYIKNRPFYTGDTVETVLVGEGTVSFAENNGLYMAQFPSTFEATVGETYKVYWDGAAYECACVNYHDILTIGNLAIIEPGSDTGEPFVMGILNGERIQILTADTSASHTFSISAFDQEVVKIDKKYLVQPDWNQNDSTQPDYVKNRPFYTVNPVETVLVEESTVTFAEGRNGKYQGELSSTFSATVGETYKVYWDGVAYECTCVDFKNTPAIGNLSITEPGSDTGEPFIMGILNGERIRITTAETSASHTVSIATVVSVVKIDAKYLPNTVATKSDVDEKLGNCIKTVNGTAPDSSGNVEVQAISRDALSTNQYGTVIIVKNGVVFKNRLGRYAQMPIGESNVAFLVKEGETSNNRDTVFAFAVATDTSNGISGDQIRLSRNGIDFESENVVIRSFTSANHSADVIQLNSSTSHGVMVEITKNACFVLPSSTSGSTKKFKITVDDSGTLTATEVS